MVFTCGCRSCSWEAQPPCCVYRPQLVQALELVWQEMARPDLTVSMRCGLLSLTRTLCQLAPVKRFWEESAGMNDAEVRECACAVLLAAQGCSCTCQRCLAEQGRARQLAA